MSAASTPSFDKLQWRWKEKKYDSHSENTLMLTWAHPLASKNISIANGADSLAQSKENSDPSLRPVAQPEKRQNGAVEKAATKSSAAPNDDSAPDFIDPLGATFDDASVSSKSAVDSLDVKSAHQNGYIISGPDALRNTLTTPSPEKAKATGFDETDSLDDSFVPWSARKLAILKQFTTTEKLSVVVNAGGASVVAERATAQHRLEQFDDRLAGRRQADLSQQEYVEKINALGDELRAAWHADQRVQSVKIVIECARLLADVSVPSFYPSQFVLVTDVLDAFGHMVYERLCLKANAERRAKGLAPLAGSFTVDQIPDGTRETATNWFYKVACCKELLPRAYVEMALLPCRRFTDRPAERQVSDTVYRLATTMRGLSGHPLMACYARAYLCRAALRVCPASYKQHVWRCIHDTVQCWAPSHHTQLHAVYAQPGLFAPALGWLCQCVSQAASASELLPLWEYCKQAHISALMLPPLLHTLPAHHIAGQAVELCQLIAQLSGDQQAVLVDCISTFASRLIECEPSPDVHRLLLRHQWRAVMKLSGLDGYVRCARVWLQFTCAHFGCNEINTLLEDIIRHVAPDEAFKNYSDDLTSMLECIVDARYVDFSGLFGMSCFVPFLDLFQKESVNLKACHILLHSFVRHARHSRTVAADVSLAAQILSLCKTLHDSLNAQSIRDERISTGGLIERALDMFTFEGNPQQALDFLIDARGALTDLDAIIQYLVQRCNGLLMGVHRSGSLTRRTAGLLRACLAYTYITIPSIVQPHITFHLYVQSAMAALVVCCLPQAEAMFKSCIQLLAEWPAPFDEAAMAGRIAELLSALLVMPDSPEHATPLYLFNGLLNALNKQRWSAGSEQKQWALVHMLHWLSAQAQPELPYHIVGVESNDTLYGGDRPFLDAIQQLSDHILSAVVTQLSSYAASDVRRVRVAARLLECCLCCGQLPALHPPLIHYLLGILKDDSHSRPLCHAVQQTLHTSPPLSSVHPSRLTTT